MGKSNYYAGRVHSVVFENAAQDFYILKLVLDPTDDVEGMSRKTGGMVTVRGTVPGLALKIGSWFGFEAKWETHPQYGKQLVVTKAPVIKGGWTPETAKAMLMSHGVGERICARLDKAFGKTLVEVLDAGDAEDLTEIPGITPFTAAHILSRWKMVRAFFSTLEFLADAGVPKNKVSQVWSYFGDEAQEILSSNPWALVMIEGIRFSQADEVALRLELDMNSPFRVQGAVLYACKTRRGMGHLFLSSGDMMSEVQGLVPGVTGRQVAESLATLHKAKKIIIDRSTRPGTTAIYEPWLHSIEKACARMLLDRTESAEPNALPTPTPDSTDKDKLDAALAEAAFKPYGESLAMVGPKADAAYKSDPDDLATIATAALTDWSDGNQMDLSEAQLRGAMNALVAPVSCLTGLPGTGKTTTLVAVVSVLKDAGISFLLCAPTGIAAKRMSSVAGAPASTIHRAFKAQGWSKGNEREATYAGIVGDDKKQASSDGSEQDWGYSADNPHPAKVVLCDEASMVDQHLLFRMLSCTAPGTRLVFIGDAAQLPSVGPGNVLRDMLSTGIFPTVSLTDIFRQEETSDIVLAAHAVNGGHIPAYGKGKGSDFVLLEAKSEEDVLAITTSLVAKLYGQRRNFQVLSPRHAGTLGVTNLNQRLREILNPKAPGLNEMRLGKEVVREDDRVMVVQNNYNKGIFNGDVGKIARLDRKAREVEIKLHGPPIVHVRLSFKDAPKYLRLAYCVTVHKCVHPDTLVETPTGLLPIRDIDGHGEIATPEGERPYRNKVVNPERSAVRITTRGGYTLTATPDHGIDVWDGGQYVRREAGELRKGDLVRLRLGTTSEPPTTPTLPKAPQHDMRAVVYKIPTLVGEDVAEFLGLMVADGTVYPKGFRLAKRHEDTVARFAELCWDLFGVRVRRYHTNGAHHAEVNSTFLSAWLSSVGGLDPHDKAVPVHILRSPSRLQARFLRGLFADGSVNVKDGCLDHIEWTCKFDTLPNVVRTMLLRFGIPCGTTPNRGIHTVYIYGRYAQLFGDVVGFPSEAKRGRLLLPCGDQTKYFVPVSKAEAHTLRKNHLDVLGHSTCGNAVQRGRLSLHKLILLVRSGTRTPTIVRLVDRANKYHHEPVVSVEATTCPSVCVEVPNGHRFLQNGFSAWNSQGQEYDIIVMPLVKGFAHQLQRNLFYTGITRAKKRVFLLGHREAMVKAVLNNRENIRNTLFPDRLMQESARVAEGGSIAIAAGT